MTSAKENKFEPRCKLIGENGNIFNLLGLAGSALKQHGMQKEANEMRNRVFESKNYQEALGIIQEYVNAE